ncbi:MAG: RNase H-like domain-containing protein, partial [Bacteroidota bacterium]
EGLPVAYWSKGFTDVQQRYSATERELAAVVYAVRHFYPYLGDRRFTLVTDHSALRWLATMKETANQRISTWLATINSFDFDIRHQPGRLLAPADMLSRVIGPQEEKEEETQEADVARVVAPTTRRRGELSGTRVEIENNLWIREGTPGSTKVTIESRAEPSEQGEIRYRVYDGKKIKIMTERLLKELINKENLQNSEEEKESNEEEKDSFTATDLEASDTRRETVPSIPSSPSFSSFPSLPTSLPSQQSFLPLSPPSPSSIPSPASATEGPPTPFTYLEDEEKEEDEQDDFSQTQFEPPAEMQGGLLHQQWRETFARAMLRFLWDGQQDENEELQKRVEKEAKYFALRAGYLEHKGKAYLPRHMRADIIHEFHDSPMAGHPGVRITYDKINDRYSWPGVYTE